MNRTAEHPPEAEDTENLAEELSCRLASRVSPSAHFAQGLGHEIRRAARQRIGPASTASFYDMVVELRRLVRLLCKTLVPVPPRVEFVHTLGRRLRAQAADLIQARERRWRWLMLGGVVGSVVSVVGVVATVFLRRRLSGAATSEAQGAISIQDSSAKAA